MLDFLKTQANGASKWTKWFWFGLILLAIAISTYFLARHAAYINKTKQLLLEKETIIADERARAVREKNLDERRKMFENLENLKEEHANIEERLHQSEADYENRKKQLEEARTWDTLEQF